MGAGAGGRAGRGAGGSGGGREGSLRGGFSAAGGPRLGEGVRFKNTHARARRRLIGRALSGWDALCCTAMYVLDVLYVLY